MFLVVIKYNMSCLASKIITVVNIPLIYTKSTDVVSSN